jgi:hypothetical protein
MFIRVPTTGALGIIIVMAGKQESLFRKTNCEYPTALFRRVRY